MYSYFNLSDSNFVLGVKIPVIKILRLTNDKGEPMNDQAGAPMYFVQTGNPIIRILSKEEYAIVKTMEGFE